MATTPNYGFIMPDPTDFVTDLPADFEIFGDEVDSRIKALNPETTAGDISYRGATANAKVRLPIGTAGQVLRVNSGATAPEWFTPAAGGGMDLLSTTAITNVASINITGIDQTYDELIIVIENAATVNNNSSMRVSFNSNTTGGQYAWYNLIDGVNNFGSANGTELLTAANLGTSANTNSINNIIRITRYTSTTRKVISWIAAYVHNSGSTNGISSGTGSFLGSAAITSVQVFPVGNFTAQGNIFIYGVK